MSHLIDIESLTKQQITSILNKADEFLITDKASNKPSYQISDMLKNKTIFNLFYEPSTRTRASFEIASKNLAANVINLDVANSSIKKGESLKDTTLTLKSMQADAIIVRHSQNDTAKFMADVCENSPIIINAGNGITSHPTQALLDVFTILKHKPDIQNIKVSIIGDVLHSRVARSLIAALKKIECTNINIIAPQSLLPEKNDSIVKNVNVYKDIKTGLVDSDVVVGLRLQKERMKHTLILNEEDYLHRYGITSQSMKYAKDDAIVMHPGPINRNIEISGEIADGNQNVILEQVTNGVAIRMAILALYLD